MSAVAVEVVQPEIILDLSRLLSRILHPTPTGIDRVEMAYARELLRLIPDQLHFAAVQPYGAYGRLPRRNVLEFLDQTEMLWNGQTSFSKTRLRLQAAAKLFQLRPRRIPSPTPGRVRIYLQASPHHLDRPGRVRAILQREAARFVCLVHDLIPIQYPEYARPGGAERHGRRIDTLGQHADALVANSAATREALIAYLTPTGGFPDITVAHLGTHVGAHTAPTLQVASPYFICVGTIEPRKNHLLLLNLWRRMAEEKRPGEIIPKLVLIGRRGWENENVIDMLDRCPSLTDHVVEAKRVSDRDIEGLIRGAKALLLPSFAEGYGMPVAEALAMNVPVICSDIAALREVGGQAPEYLDPVDGMAWLSAIRAYATEDSRERAAQQERIASWSMPTWPDHLKAVLTICSRIATTNVAG